MTHDYPQWRKARCPHCAAGMPMSGTTAHANWKDTPYPDWFKCTAPTEAEYIAELEAVIQEHRRIQHRGVHGIMTTKDELKPCPFCCGAGRIDKMQRSGYELYGEHPDAYAYYVRCASCACRGPWVNNEQAAKRMWNMRDGKQEVAS